MSKSGGVSIIDISSPANIRLLGSRIGLPGTGFEMYRKGDVLYAMSNAAVTSEGEILPPSTGTTVANNGSGDGVERQEPIAGSAVITAIDVRDPAHAKKIATFKVPGEIADSRAVGDVLYLVSYETGQCWSCSSVTPRTVVTSFDVANPSELRKVDPIAYAPDQPSYSAWKRSVAATKDRLYVAGPDWGWDGRRASASTDRAHTRSPSVRRIRSSRSISPTPPRVPRGGCAARRLRYQRPELCDRGVGRRQAARRGRHRRVLADALDLHESRLPGRRVWPRLALWAWLPRRLLRSLLARVWRRASQRRGLGRRALRSRGDRRGGYAPAASLTWCYSLIDFQEPPRNFSVITMHAVIE